jgi:hypothetical protein
MVRMREFVAAASEDKSFGFKPHVTKDISEYKSPVYH